MMKKKRSGLKGGSSWHSRHHSGKVRGKVHADDKLRKGAFPVSEIVNPLYVPIGPTPSYFTGKLTTGGNLTWLLDDGKLKSVSDTEFTAELDEFVNSVIRAGGPMRKAGKKKGGGVYLQTADTQDPMPRNTVVFPPWFCKIWSQANPQWRIKAKEALIPKVYALCKKRWPEVEFKGLSLHDDTDDLHVDVWATELCKQKYTVRGKTVEKFVTKGQLYTSGLVGAGATFIQIKADLGHDLHKIDAAKLEAAYRQYEVHRSLTKKDLPDIPEEISFYRELDSIVSGLFNNKEYTKKQKAEYLDYCKLLDKHKYEAFDQLEELAVEKMELATLKEEHDLKVETDREALQRELSELDLMVQKVKKLEADLDVRIDSIMVNDKPTMDWTLESWEKSPAFRDAIKKAPKRSAGLIKKLSIFKDPAIVKMREEMKALINFEPSK